MGEYLLIDLKLYGLEKEHRFKFSSPSISFQCLECMGSAVYMLQLCDTERSNSSSAFICAALG